MLFNKEIEGLHDDDFEGSLNESLIFTEVFFENDRDMASKRCLVTGVINFECDYGKHTDLLLCSNSENSAVTSQVDSCNVKEDSRANSALGCFSKGCALLMRNDHDVNGKRMKLSVDELSYSRPYSDGALNSPAPSRGVVSGMSESASQSVCHTVTCRLVESSSQVVTSSCYLLKRQAETNSGGEMADKDVSKCRLQSLDGSDEKKVNASKAIASPVSQESFATKLLVASPSVTVAHKSGSRRCAAERTKPSNFGELSVAKIPLNIDAMKDPRPILRNHVQNLLREAGWEIGRRKREDNINGEFLYLSPWRGRPIREFRRAWNLCGQSLCANRNIVLQEDGKEWTDMTHFWSDLSNTFIKIEEGLNNKETTAALAHRWYLLDPFANMVFIDKKLGTLRAGIVVKARRSLVIDTTSKDDTVLALKNVDTIGNQSERNSTNQLCDSSMVRESALAISEGIYYISNEKCGNGSAACFGQLQRGAGKALKGVSVYLSEDKCTHSTSTVSGTGTRRRDFSSDHSSSCLFEVPITSENANITSGGSETVYPHHARNTNSPRCDRHRSDHSEEITLEVKSKVSMGSSEEHKTFNEVTQVVEDQLKGSLDDHLNCRSDGLTQSNGQNGTHLPLHTHVGSVSKSCWPSLTDNNHFVDMVDAEVMQHSGFSEQCIEISKFKMNGAYYAADAILKRKGPKKSKRISEVKLLTLYRNNKLGLSTSYKTERPDNNMNSIQLASVGVNECFIATNERTDRSCKKSFVCSSQHRSGKKQSRFRKFHQSSGNLKTSNQFSTELNFVNITDESPLYIENESLHPQAWRQDVKSGKSETQNESGQKRLITCQLKDDDLLISAIIKNKTFGSTTKRATGKMKSCKSEALRKRKSQKGSCRLLPRSLGKGGKHIEGKWIFGIRSVLSWLIDSGVVSLNEVIQYRNPKDDAVVKNGLVTRDGILCKCCNKVLSVSEFKIHAGFRLNRPCLNLFMESGKPFTLCQLEAWSAEYKARKSATKTVQVGEMDQNDDSCGLCGDGGELICCDNCPSTFHQACLYSQELPEGSWYCVHCTCQICGDVVKEPFKSPGALKCSQCKHKYHEACLKQKDTCIEVASDTWYCSESCQEVYLGLHSRIGFVNLLSDGFSWILLRCIHGDQRVHSAQRFVALKAECNSKLAVALTIMEECFLSMVDPRTGIDMIPHVLYNWGSQFARLNYCGFYTMVLEKDDVLMSVASIRIHGVTVAEMPLIATCSKYRRQGMCRRLMNSLEEMLKSLKIEKLVISAIPSLVETWTVGFGFKPLEDSERKSLSNINLMVFPGTVWLKKPIYENQATNQQGSGHASPLIIDDPTETGACSQEVESRKQSDGSYSVKEVDALTEIRHAYSSNVEEDEDQDGSSPKHFSKLSLAEPTSTIGGFQLGPITESRKQSVGSSPMKEEGAITEIRHANISNMQVDEDQDSRLRKHFSELSCEEPASTVGGSQLEIACHVESVVMYDERKLSWNEKLQKTHMWQDNEK